MSKAENALSFIAGVVASTRQERYAESDIPRLAWAIRNIGDVALAGLGEDAPPPVAPRGAVRRLGHDEEASA